MVAATLSEPSILGFSRTSTVANSAPRPMPRADGPRIRLFNVKYSPNLGDGLLSECLERALIDNGAHADTWSIDLAARVSFNNGARGRSFQLRILDAIPPRLRNIAVRPPLAIQSLRLWRPHYRAALDGANCVVIGGGNLLADHDLNFPTKLSVAMEEAARRDLPVFIYGCGVSSNWSSRGLTLLRKAIDLGTLRSVYVRDEYSRRHWNDIAGSATGLEAKVVRDPGLLAAASYGISARRPSHARPVIGLNITSDLALRYHAKDALSAVQMDAWYLALARLLIAAGYDLAVFTNGSPEDRACAARLRPAIFALRRTGHIDFPDVNTPADLTRAISELTAIVAFRMHAVIAAYACAVPFLALAWDPKLDAFVQSVDREHWLCHPRQVSPQKAAQQLIAAIAEGVTMEEHTQVVAQAGAGIAALQNEISEHLA